MHAHHDRPRPVGFVPSGLLALASLAPVGARAAREIKVAELPVHMVGTRAMATVSINDQDVPLMVETGAFFSFLNEAAAAQLKLATHRDPNLVVQRLVGRVDVRVTTVDRLKLSKGTIPNADFIVGGNEMGSGAMGLIGRNLLNFADTEYDLAHGMIRFVFPNDECGKTNMAYQADDPATVSRVDLLVDYDRLFSRQPLRATAKYQTDAALAELAELDRTLPTPSQIRSSMADLHAALNMPAQVLAQLDAWIQFHPHDIGLADAYDERCWSRVRLNVALDKDLDDCDAAIDLDDKAASFLASHGWVRLRMGQWARAKSDFDKALARNPEFTTALYGRGIAQARLGDADASQADLAAARRLQPKIAEDMQKPGLSEQQLGGRP